MRRRARALMRLASLVGLALGACEAPETIQHRIAIRNPPPVDSSAGSTLQVPQSCPVYAPGGGDVDTPEPPFPLGVEVICVVDDTGGTYGIVTGDAPTARLAIVPGNRELGMYFGFDEPARGALSGYDDLAGDGADIKLWSSRPDLPGTTEQNPGTRLELRAIAKGTRGMLVSLGRFGTTPTEVGGSVGGGTWYLRFYVSGP